jgi:hypothetical protein
MLARMIERMTPEQRSCDVTAEVYDGETECFAGTIKICNKDHDSLDDLHPVLFVDTQEDVIYRVSEESFNEYCKSIGLDEKPDDARSVCDAG